MRVLSCTASTPRLVSLLRCRVSGLSLIGCWGGDAAGSGDQRGAAVAGCALAGPRRTLRGAGVATTRAGFVLQGSSMGGDVPDRSAGGLLPLQQRPFSNARSCRSQFEHPPAPSAPARPPSPLHAHAHAPVAQSARRAGGAPARTPRARRTPILPLPPPLPAHLHPPAATCLRRGPAAPRTTWGTSSTSSSSSSSTRPTAPSGSCWSSSARVSRRRRRRRPTGLRPCARPLTPPDARWRLGPRSQAAGAHGLHQQGGGGGQVAEASARAAQLRAPTWLPCSATRGCPHLQPPPQRRSAAAAARAVRARPEHRAARTGRPPPSLTPSPSHARLDPHAAGSTRRRATPTSSPPPARPRRGGGAPARRAAGGRRGSGSAAPRQQQEAAARADCGASEGGRCR
jgi:hypothetical protein